MNSNVRRREASSNGLPHIGTHRGIETVPHKQQQFGIQHLLVATFVAAFAISIVPYLRNVLPEYRDLAFWCSTIIIGTYARWLGWKLNWPPGSIGRHAIAFFTASIGCAGMIILLNYRGSWSNVIRDIPQGLGAAAMVYGIFAGAIIESALWLLSLIHSAKINALRNTNDAHDRGEPVDERDRRWTGF